MSNDLVWRRVETERMFCEHVAGRIAHVISMLQRQPALCQFASGLISQSQRMTGLVKLHRRITAHGQGPERAVREDGTSC